MKNVMRIKHLHKNTNLLSRENTVLVLVVIILVSTSREAPGAKQSGAADSADTRECWIVDFG